MKKIRVAMIAPPWLDIPPHGYGGIENVIAVLVPQLKKLGVTVDLYGTGGSHIRGTKTYSIYKEEQYSFIHRPYYDALPIIIAHIQFALNTIRQDGGYDLIHDHNPYIGPAMLANMGDDMPPALHTIHGPPFTTLDRLKHGIPSNLSMWQQLSKTENLYYVNISASGKRQAPSALRRKVLPYVHNGIDVNKFTFRDKKSDYFMTLARSHPDKGQRYAISACLNGGYKLKLAGVIGEITTPRQAMIELANPASKYRGLIDFRYFSDYIFPHLDDKQIQYVGDLKGQRKLQILSRAKALLFPIRWEEPFGMAPIEALACGTPVIAMARGALPEIIKHGHNGFLAHTQREFEQYMKRIDEIDPANCRQSVEQNFSSKCMAKNYLDRYKFILDEQNRL